MNKTPGIFRTLAALLSRSGARSVSGMLRSHLTSQRLRGCLTEQQKGEFAVQMFSKSWALECSKQGVQAPLIVLKRGPRNEGRFEMYWESEPYLLAVALTALGGDVIGSLAERRATLEQRVEEGWRYVANVKCQVEPGRPARMVETFSSFAQMIAVVYAEALVMHKSALQG